MRTLFQYKSYIILFFGLWVTISAYYTFQLDFHHEIEAFYPNNDPDLKFLEKFQKKVEPDDIYYLVGLYRQQGIFDSTLLNKAHQFTLDCRSISNITDAQSLTTLQEPIQTPMGLLQHRVLHFNQPNRYKKDSAAIVTDPRWRNRMIDPEGQMLIITLKTTRDLSQKEAEQLDKAVHDLIQDYNFKQYHIVGKPNVQNVFVQKIESELKFFVIAGIIMLIIILAIIFRTTWGVIIPTISVLSGLVIFFGLLGMSGYSLTLLSTMYPTLLLIVGMSDVIHIMNKYIEEMQFGKSRETAMYIAIKEIGWATLLTSFTTAVGFCALITSKIQPIREFGLIAAGAVLLIYGVVLLFTTSLLLYFNEDQLVAGSVRKHLKKTVLARVYFMVQHYPRTILSIAFTLLIIALIGIQRINTNVHLLTDISRQSKVWQDFSFFEEQMGGGRTFEMAILPKNTYRVNHLSLLRTTDSLIHYLKKRKYIMGISSPVMLYKSLNKTLHGGQRRGYRLPADSTQWIACTRLLDKTPPDKLKAIMSTDRRVGRISARMKDVGSNEVQKINKEITHWIHKNLDTSRVQFRHTGTSLVIDNNNKYLRESLFSGLIFAFLVIGAALGFLFRDIKLVLISYLPNLLPLIIVGGVMGWLGITFKASTSIIFMVGYGIAVDDTIHYLARLQLERGKGISLKNALYLTMFGTGQAILLTSVILIAGFLILLTSNFMTTVYEGLLISITLLTALLADLFVLPICLEWLYRKK